MPLESPPSIGVSPPRLTPSAAVIATILGVAAIAVVLVATPSTLFDLDRFSVPKELVLHAAALLTGAIMISRPQAITLGVVEVGLLLFGAWSVVAAILATNHWLAARSLGVTLSGIVLFFAARYAAAGRARWLVAASLAVAVLLGGLTGLAQSYGWASVYLADTRAPGGTLGNRNFMAHLTVLGLPLAGWLLATARRRASILLSLLLTAFGVAAIVLSRSRAAWVGLVATIVVVGVTGLFTRGPVPRLPRRRLFALGGAMVIGAAAALALPNRLEWRSSTPYRDSLRGVLNYREGSGRGRLIQYRNTMALARRHPVFGVGPGNWVVAYPTVTTPNDPSFNSRDPMPTNPWPSSDWVALVAERGPAGLVLWLLVVAAIAIVAIRRTRDPDPGRGAAALAALGILAAVSVEGMFDAVLLLAPPTIVTMAGLGALLPSTRPIRPPEATPRRRLIAVLLVIAQGGFTLKSLGQLQAIRVAQTGSPSSRLERAVRYDPANYRLNLLLALRGSCPDAGEHARRLTALFPWHSWPRRLAAKCD